ncbi:MAG: hypothetical protein JSW00_14550 [Thermoplasmata archaeon]|nr:MAG: hypothetical protein JSW00_14550 [Thermoplasmata archaeon]
MLSFSITTYLVGVEAESTGNLDTIGGFYMLLLMTISWSCIIISGIIELWILQWFGVALTFLTVGIGLIIIQKLSNIGLYSEIPTIFIAASRYSYGDKGEFSNIPFEAEIGKYNMDDIKKYTKILLKYGIALRVTEDADSITIYIRKPSNLVRTILLPGSVLFGQSWIKIRSDGHIIISVSKNAYEYLDSPGLYNELCKAISRIIDESINQYYAGDEQGALRKLGIK